MITYSQKLQSKVTVKDYSRHTSFKLLSVMSKRSKSNVRVENDQQSFLNSEVESNVDGGLNMAPSSRQNLSGMNSAVVAALQPPLLVKCSNIVHVIKFKQRFDLYLNMGGQIPLINCFGQYVAQRLMFKLEKQQTLNTLSNEELFRMLYKTYAPRTAPLAWEALQLIKYENGKANHLEAAPVFMFVTLFVTVLEHCSELGAKDEIVRIFMKNLSHMQFSDRLKKMGFKNKDYSEWPEFVLIELEKHLESLASFRAFQPVKSETKSKNSSNLPSPNIIAATVQNSSSSPKSLRWPSDMCLGCGHVTSPPHKRRNCPHKGKVGWCADGVPAAPMVVPVVTCSDSVSLIQGKVGPCLSNIACCVSIGLDSMSSYSLVSPALYRRICATEQISIVRRNGISVYTASGGYGEISSFVKLFVNIWLLFLFVYHLN